ncbi:MAG: transcriptional regulator [Bacteroidales bacterium]|nr:transcriptional regulator [Bacteroidales bacterium]
MIQDVDRIIHEPARLLLLIYLFSVEKADFTFLKTQTGMTQGNLSSHLQKLEIAGYIRTEKKFQGKRPLTLILITDQGREAFRSYVKGMHHYFSDLLELVD